MSKEEWGTKRLCPTTGKRFYDLNRTPIVSPYTNEVVVLETGKGSRTMLADKADKSAAKKDVNEDEDVILEDDEDDDTDEAEVDLGDDVLEDDEDDSDVSLDDIADVAVDDD